MGRAHPGAYGIARSYEEAREGLTMATRMHLDRPIVETRDVLTYRVLARDQPALVDLVRSVLDPLREARGGAGPLVETLAAYFDSGCVATATAARLHLSVRAVTYRLDRVKSLTGFDPLDPAHRFTLQVAVLGAKLLGWPEHGDRGRRLSTGRAWAGEAPCRATATPGRSTRPGPGIAGQRVAGEQHGQSSRRPGSDRGWTGWGRLSVRAEPSSTTGRHRAPEGSPSDAHPR